MREKFYKKGRDAYLIEMVVVHTKTVAPGTAESWLESMFDTEDDGSTPRAFKNRLAAQKRVAEILDGSYFNLEVKAYSIRRFKLTVERTQPEAAK